MRGIFLDMLLGRPKATLELSAEEGEELSGFAASRSLPHALVSRAKLVLWSGDGVSNSKIAERLDWSKATVGKWRQRFIEHRIQGLYDELRPGRPRTISDEKVATPLQLIKVPPYSRRITHDPNDTKRNQECHYIPLYSISRLSCRSSRQCVPGRPFGRGLWRGSRRMPRLKAFQEIV